MKLLSFSLWFLTPHCGLAYSIFGSHPLGSDTELDMKMPREYSSKFNPAELLGSSDRPEVYTKAMVELQRLEQEPVCHRLAAQLLINNCKGVEDMQEQGTSSNSARLQQHHVESFACGLSMCDLERAKFLIPKACIPFGSAALYQASRDKQNVLEISSEQVGDCLEALAQDYSLWGTWLSYRDKSLLFCRAARLDIDKDQAILLHKQLLEIMNQLNHNLRQDLENLHFAFQENQRAADSYFESVLNHAESLKSKFYSTFDSITGNLQNADVVAQSILSSSNDVLRVMKTFVQTALQTNAEMAAAHGKALAVATDAFETRVGNINEMVGETEANLILMRESLQLLFPMIVALNERQDTLEQKSQRVLSAMENTTELLQSHFHKLERASSSASGINANLERAAAAAEIFQESVGMSGGVPDWVLRLATPLSSLLVGSYGLSPSITRNSGLIVGGILAGEGMVWARHSPASARIFNILFWNAAHSPNIQSSRRPNLSIAKHEGIGLDINPSSAADDQMRFDLA